MPFTIVRNDITKMNTEAIVNTANEEPAVGSGCDLAVYEAAGFDELLSYRKENIGFVKEGNVFLTPGFRLPAKYIIHAVSPLYIDGKQEEEKLLRSCYRKSLALAAEKGIRSIAFPLISTGGFGYPKEEGIRIAFDEIHAFLLTSDMQVYLVVFDEKTTKIGQKLYPDLEAYIDRNYVQRREAVEYGDIGSISRKAAGGRDSEEDVSIGRRLPERKQRSTENTDIWDRSDIADVSEESSAIMSKPPGDEYPDIEELEKKLAERMAHTADTFSQYLLYLIRKKGLKNSEVYKRAIIDKKVFSKIKNNPKYHPQKLTALCLCIGARLNLDESKDLLKRAGYAFSPCDKTDIIFTYFIENEIFDMIELDIQLEEHGLPCVIE